MSGAGLRYSLECWLAWVWYVTAECCRELASWLAGWLVVGVAERGKATVAFGGVAGVAWRGVASLRFPGPGYEGTRGKKQRSLGEAVK